MIHEKRDVAMTTEKMIRVLLVLCLFTAGCGGYEAPGPPPQRQRPPSVFDDPAPDPDCYGFIRHGPFSADRENIDEVRSFMRLCDTANSLDPEQELDIRCFLTPPRGSGWGVELDCDIRCPESDRSCVNVLGGGVLVGTLNSERFRDIFSPSSRDHDGTSFQLERDRDFFLACSRARNVEKQCYE